VTRILGIDPGRKGALAVMARESHAVWQVETHDMPAGIADLQSLLPNLTPVAFAVVEKPFYPRSMGTTNAARSAEAYGALLASLHAAGIPIREVRPDEWKRALNVPKDKNGARQMAAMMFPDDAGQWPLIKHDGRAEAALLAWYGLRWAR
jgi:Holliday junction resolvasome RuvABC endonuclease subunit